jgi:hypothetical protein
VVEEGQSRVALTKMILDRSGNIRRTFRYLRRMQMGLVIIKITKITSL